MVGDVGLRDGWRVVPFREIARNVTERVDDPGSSGLDHYVGLEHLDPDTIKINRWGSPSDVEATKLRFYPGDVIYARRRAYQRKLGVAEWEGIASAHALVLRAQPDVCIPDFLPYFLQSDQFHQRAIDISVGSLSPTINWTTLAAQEFALPPVADQAAIAEVMGATFGYLDAVSDVITQADALSDALLTEVTRSAPRSVRLDERVDVRLGRQRHPRFASGPDMRPYIRAANVKDGYFDLRSVYEMNFDPREQQALGLRHGDVLVSEGCGNIDEVGANAVWNGEVPGTICFQNTVIRLRAVQGKSDPAFLGHWARYAFRSGLLKSIALGTNIWHLSSERTGGLPFPDLSVDAQRGAAAELTALVETRRAAEEALSAAQSLRRQLSAALMSGNVTDV